MKIVSMMVLASIFLAALVLAGCGGSSAVRSRSGFAVHQHPMAPLSEMPKEVQQSGRRLQEAYQFAVANREIADEIPCYCGCAGMGHTSSYDCYVAGVDENGVIQFDPHAQYCSICLDITHDTMRLMDEGKSTADIYTQIEADYARFAPPTLKPAEGES